MGDTGRGSEGRPNAGFIVTRDGEKLFVYTETGEAAKDLKVALGAKSGEAQLALLPEQLVGERGDVAHVDAAADDHAALCDGSERGRDQGSYWGEDDRRVQLFRGGL